MAWGGLAENYMTHQGKRVLIGKYKISVRLIIGILVVISAYYFHPLAFRFELFRDEWKRLFIPINWRDAFKPFEIRKGKSGLIIGAIPKPCVECESDEEFGKGSPSVRFYREFRRGLFGKRYAVAVVYCGCDLSGVSCQRLIVFSFESDVKMLACEELDENAYIARHEFGSFSSWFFDAPLFIIVETGGQNNISGTELTLYKFEVPETRGDAKVIGGYLRKAFSVGGGKYANEYGGEGRYLLDFTPLIVGYRNGFNVHFKNSGVFRNELNGKKVSYVWDSKSRQFIAK